MQKRVVRDVTWVCLGADMMQKQKSAFTKESAFLFSLPVITKLCYSKRYTGRRDELSTAAATRIELKVINQDLLVNQSG